MVLEFRRFLFRSIILRRRPPCACGLKNSFYAVASLQTAAQFRPLYSLLLLMLALRRVGGLSAKSPLDLDPVASLQTAAQFRPLYSLLLLMLTASARGRPQ